MSNKGWIKLYRQIQDCWIWQEKESFDHRSAWLDLLLLANHEDKKIFLDGEMVTIKRGQYHTSICKLSDRWHWERKKTTRFLSVLENDQMITTMRSRRGTTVTIENYGVYQSVGVTDGTTDGTIHGTTHGTQTRTKELKNEKNIKDKADEKKAYGQYGNVQLSDKQLEKLRETHTQADIDAAIDIVDSYCQSKHKTYVDYAAAMRNWAFLRVEKNKNERLMMQKNQPKAPTPEEEAYNNSKGW